jgi:hypothetical protein
MSYEFVVLCRGVTKRCRLSWLTHSAHVTTYMSPNAWVGGGGGVDSGSTPMSTAECTHRNQINFGDLVLHI